MKTLPLLYTTNYNYKYKKNAYFLSHNGLGDNITSIGAVNYLLKYYNVIYFLCKDIYQENVKLFFLNKRVIIVPFNSSNEYNDCKRIISNTNENTDDCFIAGVHMSYLKSRITHPDLIKYKKNNVYKINYEHIYKFYNSIDLDTSIYANYFDIESNKVSKKYYDNIKKYDIVFLHTKGSNRSINLKEIIDLYVDNENCIIICANENIYQPSNPKHIDKFIICQNYVNIKVCYYIDIIKNSKYIYVINSCFSCIVYPLVLSERIKPVEYVIFNI